jgi:hypothetical protein
MQACRVEQNGKDSVLRLRQSSVNIA